MFVYLFVYTNKIGNKKEIAYIDSQELLYAISFLFFFRIFIF